MQDPCRDASLPPRRVLVASLGPELTSTDDLGLASLRCMPHVFFVQRYGLDDLEAAMRAQYELTKRFLMPGIMIPVSEKQAARATLS